jgi:hypothetical protein
MEGLPCCTQLPDSLCRFPSLEVLHIIDLPKVKRVTTTSPGFPNLRQHRSSRKLVWMGRVGMGGAEAERAC